MVSTAFFQLVLLAVHNNSRYVLVHEYEYCGEKCRHYSQKEKPPLAGITCQRIDQPAARWYCCLKFQRHVKLRRVVTAEVVQGNSAADDDYDSKVADLVANSGWKESAGAERFEDHREAEREYVEEDREIVHVRYVLAVAQELVAGSQLYALRLAQELKACCVRCKAAIFCHLDTT